MTVLSDRRGTTGAAVSNKRLGVFYILTALFGLFFLVMLGVMVPVLPAAIGGWFQAQQLGIHQLHETVAAVLLWAVPTGLALQFFYPLQRVGAMQQVLAVLLAINVSILAGGYSFPPMLVFLFVALVIAALHPARGQLLRPADLDPVLLGVALVAAVPLLLYAGGQIAAQSAAPAGDQHAEFGHWVLMGGYAIAVTLLSVAASFRQPGWRLPAWSAAILAVLFGLASLLMPGQASSVSALWAVLAIVWGVLFMALAQWRKQQ